VRRYTNCAWRRRRLLSRIRLCDGENGARRRCEGPSGRPRKDGRRRDGDRHRHESASFRGSAL